mmetsp:Transcript_3870/g.10260  ORF Transcript_3870/g.10260 Transcript_3870/m.10260 type:complete len:109 (-) Transcript_3870:105-431(-)
MGFIANAESSIHIHVNTLAQSFGCCAGVRHEKLILFGIFRDVAGSQLQKHLLLWRDRSCCGWKHPWMLVLSPIDGSWDNHHGNMSDRMLEYRHMETGIILSLHHQERR